MSKSEKVESGEDQLSSGADRHAGDAPETGTFTTDKAPTADAEGHGSSDSGITAVRSEDDEA